MDRQPLNTDRPPLNHFHPTRAAQEAESVWPNWAGLFAALMLSLVLQLAVAIRSPLVSRDALGFIEFARSIQADAAQAIATHDQHPGYPLLVLAGHKLIQPLVTTDGAVAWVWGARLPVFVAGLLVVALVWRIGREAFGLGAANAAALLAAILPLLRQNASDALSDTPHLALYLASAWWGVVAASQGRWVAACLAGAASGLAYWIRPEGLSPALVLAGCLIVGWTGRTAVSTARRWALATMVLTTAVVVALPHGWVGGRLTSKLANKPLLVAKREQALAATPRTTPQPPGIADSASSPTPPETAAAPPPRRTGPPDMAAHGPLKLPPRAEPAPSPGDLLKRSPTEILGGALVELAGEFAKGLRYLLLVPLAVACFGPRRQRSQQAPARLVLALVACQVALLLVLYYVGGYISHRHVMPLVALSLPWVGAGCMQLSRRIPDLLPQQWSPVAVRVAVVVAVVVILVPRTLRPLNPAFTPLAKAAAELRTLAAPGECLLTNARHVSFYAELPSCVLVEDHVPDVDAALNVAAPRGYDFVALDVGADINFDPAWIDQLGPDYTFVEQVEGGDFHSPHTVAIFARRETAERLALRPPSTANSRPTKRE